MSDEGKRLDRLQARLLAEGGKKLTQQELLDQLVRLGESQFSFLADRPRKMTPAQRKRLLSLPVDTDNGVSSEEIDRILYGAPE